MSLLEFQLFLQLLRHLKVRTPRLPTAAAVKPLFTTCWVYASCCTSTVPQLLLMCLFGNANELAVEVNSITPGRCSVNMPQPEADTLTNSLELRWEKLALLTTACWGCRETELTTPTCVHLHGTAGTAKILHEASTTLELAEGCSLSYPPHAYSSIQSHLWAVQHHSSVET